MMGLGSGSLRKQQWCKQRFDPVWLLRAYGRGEMGLTLPLGQKWLQIVSLSRNALGIPDC